MALQRWAKMLSETIENKGLLLREVSAQLGRRKAGIDLTSLSRMRNGLQLIPVTEDGLKRTRVLAEILGIDSREFTLSLCLEHTPDAVLELMRSECLIELHDLSERAELVLKIRKQR
jgi:hypothetical protein